MDPVTGYVISSGLASLFGGLFGNKGSKSQAKASVKSTQIGSAAATEAARIESEAMLKAAEMAAKAEEAKLAFTRETEATRKAEWQAVQDKNYAEYMAREGRLTPYRQTGAGALGRLNARMGGGGAATETLGGLMAPQTFERPTYPPPPSTPGAPPPGASAPPRAPSTGPRPLWDTTGQVVAFILPDGTIQRLSPQQSLARRRGETRGTLGALMR